MSNTTSFDDVPRGEHVAVAVVGAVGVLLNSAALVVMLTNFTKIFSNAEACFVANLALADLLTGVGGVLWGIGSSSGFSTSVSKAVFSIMWMTVAASFLTIFCMASERLIVVVAPLKAQRFFKKRVAYLCCGIVWFVSILTGSMIEVNHRVAVFVMTVMFEATLAATIVCYVAIYCTVRRLRRDSHKTAARYSAKNAKLKLEVEENESALSHRVTVRRESRVTNLVFVLVVILAITVLPYMVILQVNVAYSLFCPGCAVRGSLIKVSTYIFPLEMVNFILNPVVYAWRLPKFRQASKKTFRRLLCCEELRRKTNTDGTVMNSCSSDSDSLGNGPATIFTGRESVGTPLNNNSHP